MLDTITYGEELPFFSKVMYYSLKGITGFSAWDFVTVMTAIKLTDGWWVLVGSSIEHPDYPVNKKKIRGKVFIDGYVLTPDPETDSWVHMTYLTKIDMGGMVPNFVKNIIMNGSAEYVIKCKKIFEDSDY